MKTWMNTEETKESDFLVQLSPEEGRELYEVLAAASKANPRKKKLAKLVALAGDQWPVY